MIKVTLQYADGSKSVWTLPEGGWEEGQDISDELYSLLGDDNEIIGPDE